MASEHPLNHCLTVYSMWVLKSCGAGFEALISSRVGVVFMMRLRSSSFGENLRAVSTCQLRIWMALLKWFGHALGKFSQFIVCHPSSPTSGAVRGLPVPSLTPDSNPTQTQSIGQTTVGQPLYISPHHQPPPTANLYNLTDH